MGVRDLLTPLDFNDVWMNQHDNDFKSFQVAFKRRIIEVELEIWHSSVIEFGCLRTYRTIKNEYIDNFSPDEGAALRKLESI